MSEFIAEEAAAVIEDVVPGQATEDVLGLVDLNLEEQAVKAELTKEIKAGAAAGVTADVDGVMNAARSQLIAAERTAGPRYERLSDAIPTPEGLIGHLHDAVGEMLMGTHGAGNVTRTPGGFHVTIRQ